MSEKIETIELKFSEFYENVKSWNEGNDIISYVNKNIDRSHKNQRILLFETINEKEYLIPAVYHKDVGFIQLMIDSKYVLIGELENLELQENFIPYKIPKNIKLRESVNITLVPSIFKYMINIQDIYTDYNDNILRDYEELSVKIHLFDSISDLIEYIGNGDFTKGVEKFLSHYYLKEISWINIKIRESLFENNSKYKLEDSFSTFFFKMYISGRTLETSFKDMEFSSIIINGKRFYDIARSSGPSISSFISGNKEKVYEICPEQDFNEAVFQNIDENWNIRVYQFKKSIIDKSIGENGLVCKFLKSLQNYKSILEHYWGNKRNKMIIFLTAVNYKEKVNKDGYLQRNPNFEKSSRYKFRYSENEIFAVILKNKS